MVDFQFMSGLNTIGSNILDIRSDEGRIIFDYGEIANTNTGSLPDLKDTIENTAIFISHLHIDHIGSFRLVPKDIPIYMSKESYDLYQLLIEIGEELPIDATIFPMAYDESIQIGDITVTAKQSDHDIRGVCALFVQTPDVKLIYSGDLRLTGNHPEYITSWLAEAKLFNPDIFLLEGTTFSFEEERETLTEKELYEKWSNHLEHEKEAMFFFNTYIRDTVRLLQFTKIAKEQQRRVVLEPKYAYLLEQMEGYAETLVLKELDSNKDFEARWVDLETMQENPERYVLQNSYKNRTLLSEFKNGIYAHSNGEPLGDYDPRYVDLVEMVSLNDFEWLDLGAGGHATRADLIKIAQAVDADVTIPWHSFKPEALRDALAKAGLSTFLPSLDRVYSRKKLN